MTLRLNEGCEDLNTTENEILDECRFRLKKSYPRLDFSEGEGLIAQIRKQSSSDESISEEPVIFDNEPLPSLTDKIKICDHSSCSTTHWYRNADIELDASIVEDSPLPHVQHGSMHVFVLSEAGKPIYSRHGNEEDLTSLMGVIQALCSFVTSMHPSDKLEWIIAGRLKVVFLPRSPLILVAASCTDDSTAQLSLLLIYVYQHILSVLTLSRLTIIFEQRKNFDLRRLLVGTDKIIDHFISRTETDLSLILNAFQCHVMPFGLRETIVQTMVQYCAKAKAVIFAVLLFNNRVIALSGRKKCSMAPSDLILLITLISSNPSFRHAETWMPLCLPHFDHTSFLNAHISYLGEHCPACLVLFGIDASGFFTMSEIKKNILEKLNRTKCLLQLQETITSSKGTSMTELGIAELIHFVYKDCITSQFLSLEPAAPFSSLAFTRYLHGRYLRLHEAVNNPGSQQKICFVSGRLENMLGWVTPKFEVYAIFTPLVTKGNAITKIDLLIEWIKKEERSLFHLNVGTF